LKDPELAWAPFNEAVLRRSSGDQTIGESGDTRLLTVRYGDEEICRAERGVDLDGPITNQFAIEEINISGGKIHENTVEIGYCPDMSR
jgi:hypothetical protein